MWRRIYRQCLEGRSIRVLELQPGSGDEPIQAVLIQTTLDRAPPFEALSYVWGNAQLREEMVCNGSPLQITSSLHSALHRLRHPTGKRLLWADAVCINQDDLGERAHQVGHMREIYLRAWRVVVWLGMEREEDDVPLAIRLMKSIYEACLAYARANGHHDLVRYVNTSKAFREVAEDQLDQDLLTSSKTLVALRHFFSRSWFTRVWCVQEIVLAQSSIVLVGEHELSWEMIGVVACWLDTKDLEADFDVSPERTAIPYFNALCMFNKLQGDVEHLEHTLARFRDFRATDARDKVYAILGIVNEDTDALAKETIAVDYTREVWEIYADVAKASVLRTGNLSILSHVKHGLEYNANDDFPSWVPRWDQSQDVVALYTESMADGEAWKAGGGRALQGRLEPDESGALELRGVEFDKIAWVSPILHVEYFKDGAPLSEHHPVLDVWNQCTANGSWPYGSPTEAMLHLAPTLVGGWTAGQLPVFLMEEEERFQFYADFLAFVQHLAHTHPRQAIAQDPERLAHQDGDWRAYKVAASRGCDQRRFFRTSGGSYGLGPGCLGVGDRVVVLNGGPVPYVLRPMMDGYWFLGEAYVEELMLGEAFGGLAEKCSEERAFCLR